jgi:hypothetical protein
VAVTGAAPALPRRCPMNPAADRELRLLLGDLAVYAARAGHSTTGNPDDEVDFEMLLVDLGHLRGLLARITSCAVVHARELGVSWARIGEALGLPEHAVDHDRQRGSIVAQVRDRDGLEGWER